MIKKSLLTAFIAGGLAALLFTALQEWWVTPLIQAAETFEQVAPEQTQGLPRWLASLGANMLIVIAYGFILLAAYLLWYTAPFSLHKSLWWGAAGYMCFYLSPSFVLLPSLPGIESSLDIGLRQVIWIGTVLCSLFAVALISVSGMKRYFGIILLVMPWVILPEIHHSFNHPKLAELWPQFIVWSALLNAIMWLSLAWLIAFMFNRMLAQTDYAR